ncbi:hypothetical protein QYF61_015224 [Mycteria americana]|uniref:Uncharacterized protein n=1 Tax=Mycteria americana TaxID=33587 RepID=A0AAN7PRF6_MYCAM|nr:hypothetical protein QYF61_015224 [Mycteria americana]
MERGIPYLIYDDLDNKQLSKDPDEVKRGVPSSYHFCGPPLDPIQQVHVLPVLRAPELDTVLQVGSHQSRVEGWNHFPRPAGHASFDAAQDTVGLLGCECTLLAPVQLFVHQYPQVLFHRAALNHIIPQPVLELRIAPTQVQDPTLGLVEPHEVHTDPLPQLVQVPLDDTLSFWHVSCTTQLGVICKLAEGALDLAVNVIDDNIEQHWSQETQITATCWGLAHAYRALFHTIQNPQGEEKVPGSDDKTTGTVATPIPATGAVATPALATGTAAEPENQPMLLSVVPIHKKKYTRKSAHLVRDEDEPGPSQEQEEEEAETINVVVTTLSLSELREMQKDFCPRVGEHIVTWLLQCWDNRASGLELEGREAKQLGSLSREGGIDKVIGKGAQAPASGGDSCQA